MARPFDLCTTLDELKRKGRYRQRRTLSSPQGRWVTVDGETLLNFSSNDYLGLASHPAVVSAFCAAASEAGVGSGASHWVSGHHRFHQQLEERLAEFCGRPRALLFSSGYAANLGVVSALLDRHDVLLQDKLNHASLIDAAALSGAVARRFAHADMNALDSRLGAVDADQRVLVATDGVFSMDGEMAPLADIGRVCRAHGAWLMVDDAHGFGACGPGGRGSVAASACEGDVQVYMATLGKALGVGGAFVAGDESLIEYLVQKTRTAIYTTAQPPAMAAATLEALRLLEVEAWRRTHLEALIQRFRQRLAAAGVPVLASRTAIQPIVVGDDRRAVALSQALQARGFLVVAIRPPTVPEGTARLRVTLSAAHDESDVDRLADVLAELLSDQEYTPT